MGFGRRNVAGKWWLDLETAKKHGRAMRSGKTNARDLVLDRDTSAGNNKIAVYPFEKLPKAGQKETVPVDRKAGIADTKAAEKALRGLKDTGQRR